MAKFEKTYCSQCGGEFGPGDHGFSHCSTHEVLSRVKTDPIWAVREIERLRGWLRHIDNTDWDCGEAEAALRGDPVPT